MKNNQYSVLAEGEYTSDDFDLTDPVSGLKHRIGQRGGLVVHDKEILDNGFVLDIEDTSWENVGGFGDDVTGDNIRFGVRDGDWVVDIELTATGFDGTEDTDWENIGGIDIL